MRFLKMFGIVLLVAFCLGTIVSLVLPAKQRIEKSIVINAPATVVYEHLRKLGNMNDWAIWNKRDSSVKHTMNGQDGKVGASISWTGDPGISGDGKLEIATLNENKKIVHTINFISPKKGEAESEFIFVENNGKTTVTWEFDVATPRPRNIYNLFSSMDKTMGQDLEEGLLMLKAAIEKTTNTADKPKTYAVTPMNFPSTTYAMVRQEIQMSDVASFYSAHLPLIFGEAQKAGITPGVPTGIFYEWDEQSQQTDMAAAMSVPAGSNFENTVIQVADVSASKAVYVNYFGPYEKLSDAHDGIRKYLIEKKLKQKPPAIEQYLTDPGLEKDTAKWLTKVIYLVE
jgi:effector-binding domain-containing protein